MSQPRVAITPYDTVQAKVHQKEWADYLRVPVETTNSIGMKLVMIPPGESTMGSPASEVGRQPDETQHRVTIAAAFSLGVHEVTQAQYEQVMGSNPSDFKGANNPVEQVTWNDAMDFCARLSSLPAERTVARLYRLPTEAEWEYACRAGTTTVYSFGNEESLLGEYGWYGSNSGKSTHTVSQHKPNAWGLYDMHGNVWEWCSDWYVEYPEGPVTTPVGPEEGSFRVSRGGSWSYVAALCRSASRGWNDPSDRYGNRGFRIVCDTSRLNAAVSEIDKALPASLSEGLVAYYPFNGDAKDNSGNGNDGVSPTAKSAAGRFGEANGALAFANADAVAVPNHRPLNLTDPANFTISFWAQKYGTCVFTFPLK